MYYVGTPEKTQDYVRFRISVEKLGLFKSCMLCMWLNTMQYFCKNYRQTANIVNRSVEATFTEDFAKYQLGYGYNT